MIFLKEFEEILKSNLSQFNIEINHEQIEKFSIYARMLIEWNKKINLTAITEPKEIAVKHFADSVSLLKFVDIKKNSSVIDIGTGAGFPGIPLAIMRNDIKLTLLDSLNKRLIFLSEVTNSLGIKCNIIHSRAEEGSKRPELREKFDVAVSRAVAALNVLSEYCLPYVKIGGQFAAMKGPAVEEEKEKALSAVKILGGKINKTHIFNLGNDNTRSVIIIDKVRKTGDKYPRHGSKILKKSL